MLVKCIINTGYEASLEKGAYYHALGYSKGLVRIRDDSGESYLFDPCMFEIAPENLTELQAHGDDVWFEAGGYFLACDCGSDGYWVKSDDGYFWIEFWSQRHVRLSFFARIRLCWRIFWLGTIEGHEIVVKPDAVRGLMAWFRRIGGWKE